MRIEASPFDSEQYDLNIGRVTVEAADRVGELNAAVELARPQFDVLFLRVPQASQLDDDLRQRGDTPADVLVTSTLTERPAAVSAPSPRFSIETHDRVDNAEDLAAIEAISANVLRRSHLHNDARLPFERTQRYYAAWARNNAMGRASRTLVARAGRLVIGYLSVVVRTSATPTGSNERASLQVVIDLVAVDARWQGQGVGAALLTTLAAWLADRPGAVATVGTQADNPALKLYRRFGYTPTERDATYHLWLKPTVP